MRALLRMTAGPFVALCVLSCGLVVSFDDFNTTRDAGSIGSSDSSDMPDDGSGTKAADASRDADAAPLVVPGEPEPGIDASPPPCHGIDAATLPWTPPTVAPGSCAPADLTALVAYLDAHPAALYPDIKASVTNLACAACIFGSEAAATWAPIVENEAGAMSRIDVGGCIGIAANDVECGRSYQQWYECELYVCGGGDPACQQRARKCECKDLLDAVGVVCGTKVTNAETACSSAKYTIEGPIKAQCIGGIP